MTETLRYMRLQFDAPSIFFVKGFRKELINNISIGK